ncbi:MAG TPA: DUF4845 domain-containing protein [Gammaproteobacteria bacterium]
MNRRFGNESGITLLSFLFLATVFGAVGLAALKVTPLYIQGVRVRTVLSDLKTEMDGKGATANNLRLNLTSRLYVEGIALDPEDVRITPGNNGYNVRVQFDNRTRFVDDIYFLVAVDEQTEIRR